VADRRVRQIVRSIEPPTAAVSFGSGQKERKKRVKPQRGVTHQIS
jgi:hypothetical protein